jgi:hypothetical protein
MSKKEINLNNQRASFSKNVKRKILLELAKGQNPESALLKYAQTLKEISNDKKYAAKLLHKWRKEMYEDKQMLGLLNYDINKDDLKEEIKSMGEDDEADFEDITLDEIDLLRSYSKEIVVFKNGR